MIRTIAELQLFFETGDKPTQQEFYDWLDSFFHKEFGLGTEVTFSPSGGFGVPAKGDLWKITIWSTSAQTVKIGTTAGGAELAEEDILANEPLTIILNRFSLAGEMVHVTGTAALNAKYYII